MFTIKYILITVLFLLSYITFGKALTSPTNLFAITSNNNENSVMILQPERSGEYVFNKNIDLPNDITILDILSVDEETINLFCIDKNSYSYNIQVNLKNESINTNSPIYNPYTFNGDDKSVETAENQTYLYLNDKIYLPSVLIGIEGLNILIWDFNTTQPLLSVLSINDTSDIDYNVKPIGTFDPYGFLYVVYNAIDNGVSSCVLVIIDMKIDKIAIKRTIKGLTTSQIKLLLTDQHGEIFVVIENQIGLAICPIYYVGTECEQIHDINSLNPFKYNFTPYFISSDKQNLVTLESKNTNYLSFNLFSIDSNSHSKRNITNYWTSTYSSCKTIFYF